MGETTLQDRRSATTSHATNKYTDLENAALAFVNAQTHIPDLETGMDFAALKRFVAPSFSHSFGPDYAVSQAPKLQGTFTIDSFIKHLGSMLPALETWAIQFRNVVVDEVGESVAIRASYRMLVKGADKAVENDVVWWLEMEERLSGTDSGEWDDCGGWRVRRSTEIVDVAAAGKIKELITARNEKKSERPDSSVAAG
ncbi:hypothetical protein E8E13_007831 [Curvularia kusanoi]|uniref:Uncharacterized protein n=1 Tax=Curvularia kusanoi TaxID=90978 RepID=A0A9P4W9S9_CURKU|nr:hypothetical protein E8E13_007831 [Curvularia kusanoi]